MVDTVMLRHVAVDERHILSGVKQIVCLECESQIVVYTICGVGLEECVVFLALPAIIGSLLSLRLQRCNEAELPEPLR